MLGFLEHPKLVRALSICLRDLSSITFRRLNDLDISFTFAFCPIQLHPEFIRDLDELVSFSSKRLKLLDELLTTLLKALKFLRIDFVMALNLLEDVLHLNPHYLDSGF